MSLWDDIRKKAMGVVAQVNPFDGGQTYDSVVNNKPVQQAQPTVVKNAIKRSPAVQVSAPKISTASTPKLGIPSMNSFTSSTPDVVKQANPTTGTIQQRPATQPVVRSQPKPIVSRPPVQPVTPRPFSGPKLGVPTILNNKLPTGQPSMASPAQPKPAPVVPSRPVVDPRVQQRQTIDDIMSKTDNSPFPTLGGRSFRSYKDQYNSLDAMNQRKERQRLTDLASLKLNDDNYGQKQAREEARTALAVLGQYGQDKYDLSTLADDAVNLVPNIVKGTVDTYGRVVRAQGRVLDELTTGKARGGIEDRTNNINKLNQQRNQILQQDPTFNLTGKMSLISQTRYAALTKEIEKQQTILNDAQQADYDTTDPTKYAGAGASVILDALTAGAAGNIPKIIKGTGSTGVRGAEAILNPQNIKQGLMSGAALGTGYGASGVLQDKGAEATPQDLVAGMATGALGGIATAGVASGLSRMLQRLPREVKNRALINAADGTEPVTVNTKDLTAYEGAPDRGRVEEYKARIENGGQIEPLILMRDENGNLSVEDGKHRLQAMNELGVKQAPAYVVTPERLKQVIGETSAAMPENATIDIPTPKRSALEEMPVSSSNHRIASSDRSITPSQADVTMQAHEIMKRSDDAYKAVAARAADLREEIVVARANGHPEAEIKALEQKHDALQEGMQLRRVQKRKELMDAANDNEQHVATTREQIKSDSDFLAKIKDINLTDEQRMALINEERIKRGLEPLSDVKEQSRVGEMFAKPRDSIEMTKGHVAKEDMGVILSETKDGTHRRRLLRNTKSGVAEVIVETKQPDGSWLKSKEREPAIRHKNDIYAIDKLEGDPTLTEAAEKASKTGEQIDFYASKQSGDPNSLSSEIVKFNPEKMIIDGGFVRDAETGALLGNHIKVDDTGISINIGKNIVNMGGIVGDTSKWRNMNKWSYTMDRMLELMAPSKEVYQNTRKFVIEHKQAAEAKMRKDLASFRTDVADWHDNLLNEKPQGISKDDFKTDIFYYAERKLAQPMDAKGIKMNQDQILNAKYGAEVASKIREFDKWAREQYDNMLDRTNEVLREFGHDEIPKRKNYMTHLQEDSLWDKIGIGEDLYRDLSSGISGEANMGNRGQLPGTIAGRTENFRPTKKYNPFHQTRRGTASMTDPFKAMDAYGEAALFNIHMTESAVRARSLEAVFRTAEEIFNKDTLQKVSENLRQSLTEAHKGSRGDLVTAFQEYANALTGKSQKLDRVLQDAGTRGRVALKTARALQKVASNASIIGNANTTISQALNLPNVVKTNGVLNTVKGTSRMVQDIGWNGMPKPGTPAAESDFLTVRYTDAQSRINRTKLEIANRKMTKVLFMEQFERSMTESTWYACYEKALQDNLTGRAAVKEADRMTERIVGGRGIADQPELYRSTVGRTFLQYTLEVNAALKNLRYDNTSPATLMKYAIAVYTMNSMVKGLTGRAPLPDFLGASIDTLGDFTDADSYKSDKNPNGETVGDKLNQTTQRFTATAANLSPVTVAFVNNLADQNTKKALFGKDSDLGRYDSTPAGFAVAGKLFQAFDDLRNGKFAGAWDKSLAAIPYGAQIRKSGQGVGTMVDGYSKDSEGNAAAKVDTSNPMTWLQAALFGKNSIPEVRKYFENNANALGTNQQATFEKLAKSEGKQSAIDYLSAIQGQRDAKNSTAAKGIDTADIDAEKKVKIAQGDWVEKDGVVTDAESGNVVTSYYKKLAKKGLETDDRSDATYEAILKANDIKTKGSGKFKETGHTTLDKLNKLNNIADDKAINEQAVALIKNMGSSDDVPKWAVVRYLKDNKIDQAKAVYATKASYGNDVKLPVIQDEIKDMDHNKVLEYLTNGRIKSITGGYWVTQGVLASLRDEGAISKAEYATLNKAKYDSDGKSAVAASGGKSGGKSKVSAADLGSLTATVDIEQAIANIISKASKRSSDRKISYKKRT